MNLLRRVLSAAAIGLPLSARGRKSTVIPPLLEDSENRPTYRPSIFASNFCVRVVEDFTPSVDLESKISVESIN